MASAHAPVKGFSTEKRISNAEVKAVKVLVSSGVGVSVPESVPELLRMAAFFYVSAQDLCGSFLFPNKDNKASTIG